MVKNNSTRKNKKSLGQYIIPIFIEMLNTIKIYHWKTLSYSKHKATDKLYGELNSLIDNFIEIYLGICNCRVNLTNKKYINFYDFNNIKSFKNLIENYKLFLIDLSKYINNTDLLNIRDEILGSLDKFSFLLTLK